MHVSLNVKQLAYNTGWCNDRSLDPKRAVKFWNNLG